MCGIVGAFPLNIEGLEIDEKLRRSIMLYLHNEILFETKARGKHATGMALTFGPPENQPDVPNFWTVLKQPVDTDDFFVNDGTESKYDKQDPRANIIRIMKCARKLPRPLLHVLGHTRHKTQGSEFNPLNNHPILVGNIIGIHNGGVRNDSIIYKKHPNMTPQGEVDSEAIIQLLAEVANDRPLCEEDISYVTERIEGPYAVIAYNREHPEKIIYFHEKERPMELAYVEEIGTAFICSEKKFFDAAMLKYHRLSLALASVDLPALSYDWRNVPDNFGGVIDVKEPLSADQEVKKMFPLVSCEKLLEEYERPSTTTTVYSGHHNRHKTTSNTTVNTGANVNTVNTKKEENEVSTEIVDLSSYSKIKDEETEENTAANGETTVIDASCILSEENEETEDDDDTDDANDYDDDDFANTFGELHLRGVKQSLSEAVRNNEECAINKYSGKFKKLIKAQGVDEEQAAEVANMLYPEFFGDGYVSGFEDAAEEATLIYQTSESETKNIDRLKESNARLLGKTDELKDALQRAASRIANMKAFIMASIITNDIAVVDADGDLCFEEKLENFLKETQGFQKTKISMIKELFTGPNLEFIEETMSSMSDKVKEEVKASKKKSTKVNKLH